MIGYALVALSALGIGLLARPALDWLIDRMRRERAFSDLDPVDRWRKDGAL